jgi:hypothetical protein
VAISKILAKSPIAPLEKLQRKNAGNTGAQVFSFSLLLSLQEAL